MDYWALWVNNVIDGWMEDEIDLMDGWIMSCMLDKMK